MTRSRRKIRGGPEKYQTEPVDLTYAAIEAYYCHMKLKSIAKALRRPLWWVEEVIEKHLAGEPGGEGR